MTGSSAPTLFILEGTNGAGKTTLANLLESHLRRFGQCVRSFRNPGTTQVGLELREIIRDSSLPREVLTDILLHSAARTELYLTSIPDAIRAGAHVILDRDDLSSYAYQAGRIDFLIPFQALISPFLKTIPHQTLKYYLDLSPETQHQRLQVQHQTERADHYEAKPSEFKRSLIERYRTYAPQLNYRTLSEESTPRERLQIILSDAKLLPPEDDTSRSLPPTAPAAPA